MSRMLELVRTSQLSSHQMMSASKGALRVPGVEMIEILVYIAEHNKIFRETARLTLAGWDEASAKQIAADPGTPREVLDYWLSPQNIRPILLPVVLENPSASATKISELASTAKNELADVLIASQRVRNSLQILRELNGNHALSGSQAARVQALMGGEPTISPMPEAASSTEVPAQADATAATPASSELPIAASQPELENLPQAAIAQHATEGIPETTDSDPETENVVVAYLSQHANEIVAEGNKPFQAIGGVFDQIPTSEQPAQAKALAAAAGVTASCTTGVAPLPLSGAILPVATPNASPAGSPANAKPTVTKKPLVNPEDEKRGSTLQKISALDIKGRIQLAMKGTKEERSILVRDGTKIVALAVLESPKISDGEVEKFASQKNVLEAVLRAIPMKRRFAKNYVVMRNLVANPRTPLDVGLGLMKNLLVGDLKNLAGNKEVSETVRKMALRMFRQKNEADKK